uniref:Exocyst complex component 2 n=1 Tax=Eptatretus burgeri TaxID=7764 RepID=A0A8C4NGN4_EPTBU
MYMSLYKLIGWCNNPSDLYLCWFVHVQGGKLFWGSGVTPCMKRSCTWVKKTNMILCCAGVRNYLKEVLMSLTAVHAEVFAMSHELVSRVLSRLIEGVAEEMARLLLCVHAFSTHGALQAHLELYVLQHSTSAFHTPISRQSFKQAVTLLPQISTGTERKLMADLVNRFNNNMKLQLICFQSVS